MDITDELFKEHYHGALLYTYSLSGDYHLSEDIVSDSLYKALTSYNGTDERFKLWLFRVCRNAFIDHIRKHKRYTELHEGIKDDTDVAGTIIEKEEYRALYHAIELLNDEYREAITLFYFNNMAISEISSIMNKSEAAVKVTLHRARNKIKKILEVNYGGL